MRNQAIQLAILYLPMKKKWFDMVLSGEKKEEYREFKPYWMARVKKCCGDIGFPYSSHNTKDHGREDAVVVDYRKPGPLEICFFNGYQKHAPKFTAYCDMFHVRSEAVHPEWGEGEYAGKPHFVFHIGYVEKE